VFELRLCRRRRRRLDLQPPRNSDHVEETQISVAVEPAERPLEADKPRVYDFHDNF